MTDVDNKKRKFSFGTQELPDAPERPQEFYDQIKAKFAAERDLRLAYRPTGLSSYTSELTGDLARYGENSYARAVAPRAPLTDTVEVLFIGGGFSALLTSVRLREIGIKSIRVVERAADFGGTWYWNRYPGIACDVVAYDYLPLLDETGYIPTRHYATGFEIYDYCKSIARDYDLYDLAVFQTTVTTTTWNEAEQMWHLDTDRGDHMKARFVICANGPLTKPKLATIKGLTTFQGHSFHSGRWDYDYTGPDLENLQDKVVGIIGTGASAVQIIPNLGAKAKELYVFQRTPSTIERRNDWPTDPEWAAKLEPGWQARRRQKTLAAQRLSEEQKAAKAAVPPEEKIRRQENANIDHIMRIHRWIDEVVEDKATAEALKPWYMYMCKRPTFHNDYLPTFNRPNVHLVDTRGQGVSEITAKGPVFDGKTYEVDVLIYATGFEVQKTGVFNSINGRNGINLAAKYEDGIRTLLGIHSHDFPNLFIMAGYQSSFQFNLTDMLEWQGRHIAACIDYARQHGIQSLDATADAEEWWVQEVIKFRGTTSRNQECTPGYYNFEGEFNRRQDGNYNGGINEYIAHMANVRARMEENFILTRKS